MAIALYARKSIERENSISCETQIEYCKSVIKPDERNEKTVEFIDNGYSGGNVDRDGFQKMMRQIERGKISKVIVYRLDRISRSLSDFVGILETLKKHNVQFVSSQESFDTSSPYGFNLKDTVINNVKTKMFEPVTNEIEQIKYIFENYSVPNVTLRRLMDNLIDNNISATTGSWSTAKLSNIIKNPIYVKADNAIYEYYSKRNANIMSDINQFDGSHGIQTYGKSKHTADDMSDIKIVVMPHDGIINSDLWLKCQKKIEKNKKLGNSVNNSTSWLGGKIACKQCGRTMTVTKGGKKKDGTQTRYFSCTGKSHNRICNGPKVTLYADSLEDMVYNLIAEKLQSLKGSRKKISTDNSNKINLLKNQLSEIKQSQEKIVNMLLDDSFKSDMKSLLNEKAKKLSEESKAITEKIEDLESEENEIISVINLSQKWKSANTDERKAVCNVLIHKIFICEDGTCEVVWNI